MFDFLLGNEDEEELEDEEQEEEEEEEAEGETIPEVDEKTLRCNADIAQCFALFDPKGTGNMETRHFEKALYCLGIVQSPAETQMVLEELETNGAIPFEKFQPYAFEKMTTNDPLQEVKLAFQAFDPDREGIIPSDRLKRWLMTLGDPFNEKEAKEFMKMADPASKGLVFYENLARTLVKG